MSGAGAREGLRVEIGELVIDGFGNDRAAVIRALAAELTPALSNEGAAAAHATAVQVAEAIGRVGAIAPAGAAGGPTEDR